MATRERRTTTKDVFSPSLIRNQGKHMYNEKKMCAIGNIDPQDENDEKIAFGRRRKRLTRGY